jgi:hypothetical protein
VQDDGRRSRRLSAHDESTSAEAVLENIPNRFASPFVFFIAKKTKL